MNFIFEDKKTADLSILFRSIYPKNIREKFVYTGSNRYICSTIKKMIKSPKDSEEYSKNYIVFLDIIPDNETTISVYKSISALSRTYLERGYKIIVIPIVCAEYYAIQMIHKLRLFEMNSALYHDCVEKRFWKNSYIVEKIPCKKRDRYKNFEKYCKAILEYGGPVRCITPSDQKETEEKNKDKGAFYRNDCKLQCKDILNLKKHKCIDIPTDKKAEMLLFNYPIVPAGIEIKYEDITRTTYSNFEEIVKIHEQLVKEFNNWVDIFINSDAEENRSKYMYIEPFDFTALT